MGKKRESGNLAAIICTTVIAAMIGKVLIYIAYLERGYEAIGGEYCLISIACWMTWKTANSLLNKLEGLGHEKDCKKENG